MRPEDPPGSVAPGSVAAWSTDGGARLDEDARGADRYARGGELGRGAQVSLEQPRTHDVRRQHRIGQRRMVGAGGIAQLALRLGRRVHPPPVVAAEGPLLVVVGDDVLAQLGAHRLEDEAHVADHREVPQDGVVTLDEVVDRQGHEPDDDHHED